MLTTHTVIHARDTSVNKTDENLCFMELRF